MNQSVVTYHLRDIAVVASQATVVSTAAMKHQCVVQHEHLPLVFYQSEDVNDLLICVVVVSAFITSYCHVYE